MGMKIVGKILLAITTTTIEIIMRIMASGIFIRDINLLKVIIIKKISSSREPPLLIESNFIKISLKSSSICFASKLLTIILNGKLPNRSIVRISNHETTVVVAATTLKRVSIIIEAHRLSIEIHIIVRFVSKWLNLDKFTLFLLKSNKIDISQK